MPGKLSILLNPKKISLFDTSLLGSNGKVSCRISSHIFVRNLFNIIDFPILSTSANITGQENLFDMDKILSNFKNKIDHFVDFGKIPESLGSSIINIEDNKVLTYYNLYNATSRPTNSFNSVNFAAIPHTERHRKTFRPQNDYFIEFDFDGYHLRLLCNQVDYALSNESAHKQLAKLYFDKDKITDEEYNKAKQINFQAIYGKIPEEHKNLKIFEEIQEYIDTMWDMFNSNGVVLNPQSSKPFTKELKDMHPAKLMNYMMQSLETSNNVLILKEVLRYLKDKKTKIALYTYDAILFDFSREDGKETLQHIEKIMSVDNKYPVKFKHSSNLFL